MRDGDGLVVGRGADAARTALLVAACRRDAAARLDAAALALLDAPAERAALLARAREHGVLAQVIGALHAHSALPAAAAALLGERLSAVRARAQALWDERDDLLRALDAAGVYAVALDGAGPSGAASADRWAREPDEIDLLVPDAQVGAAVEAIAPDERRTPAPGPAPDGAPRPPLRLRRARGADVVLRCALTAPGEPWRLDAAAFLAEAVARGPGVRVPRPEHALLHAVAACVRDDFTRLARLVDVDRIVAHAPALDWPRVRAAARDGELLASLAVALELSRALLGTEVPADVRRALRPAAATRFHLALLQPRRALLEQRALRRPSWGALLRLWVLSGRARRRALAAMLRGDGGVPAASSPPRAGVPPRAPRVGALAAYQLGLYAEGAVAWATRARPGLW